MEFCFSSVIPKQKSFSECFPTITHPGSDQMNSETPPPLKLPKLDFSNKDLIPGTDDWFSIRIEVIQALEEYGCFEVVYDGVVPLELHNAMFHALEKLFDLTTETKSQNVSNKSYHGYVGPSSLMPIQEGLGIDGAPILERVQDFTKLMWPEGNDSFCETVHSFTTQVLNLTKMVMRIVFESYGVEKYYDSHIESITSLLRLIKYRVPKVNEPKLGLVPHTDKTFITILHQNQVKGLEVQTKDGEWISVIPSANSFVVIAGDSFLTWSNGRIHSPTHHVIIDGDETRYSTGLFTFSKEIVETLKEFIDEEHPLMYKSFHINDVV